MRFANGQFFVSFARIAEHIVGGLHGGRDRPKVELTGGGAEPVAHESVALASASLFGAILPSAVAAAQFLPGVDGAAAHTWAKANRTPSTSSAPRVKRLREAGEG